MQLGALPTFALPGGGTGVAWPAGLLEPGTSWGPRSRPSKVRRVLMPEELEAERRLAGLATGGDRAALGKLLERHGPRLYRAVLLPRLGNRALAEEALSLTYVRVVERIGQFQWQSVGLYPWLRVVAMRIA